MIGIPTERNTLISYPHLKDVNLVYIDLKGEEREMSVEKVKISGIAAKRENAPQRVWRKRSSYRKLRVYQGRDDMDAARC